jgi:ketosteroid isomerase-like protein
MPLPPPPPAAAAPALPPGLAAAAAAYDRAQVRGDRAELNRLLADDYVLISSSGAVETKAQFVAESSDPAFHLDPFTMEQPVTRVWGDGAVLGGVARLTGSDHGSRFDARLRFSDVWARRGGAWRVVYTHASRAPVAAAVSTTASGSPGG